MTEGLILTIERVAQGDPIAFRELFERFSPKVYSFAMRLTRSSAAAEELVQEVFLKVWIGRERLTAIENFPSYLFAITRNLALNALKRVALEQKIKASLLQQTVPERSVTEDTVIYRDFQHVLKQAIEGLPPRQKLVYDLCHGQGLRYDEVAQKLSISRFTVKTHMQEALRAIRHHFRAVIMLFPASLLF